VVSGGVPIFSRVARESGGLAVDEGDPESWRDALTAVVEAPERRISARSWAEEHDIPRWTRRHAAAISGVI
jgi:hypothetical protein